MESQASTAYSLGRFKDAWNLLESGEDRALKLELSYFLGHTQGLISEVRRLLSSAKLDPSATARCALVEAALLRDSGSFTESLSAARRSVEVSRTVGDLKQTAISYAKL